MIKVNVENKEAISRIRNKVQADVQKINASVPMMSIVLENTIKSNLYSILGKDAAHFTVAVGVGTNDITVTVASADEIGDFIFSGTKPHEITSANRPMPMPGGGFAYQVMHPGTPSRKDEIYAAVNEAMAMTRLMV